MTFNEALRKLREVVDESQQRFATRLGISIAGLRNYEDDRTPGVVVLARLQKLVTEHSDKLPEKVRKVIQNQYASEINRKVGTQEGVVSFAFSRDEGDGGLIFETLRTGEEYAYATAFKYMLAALRKGDSRARQTARRLFDEALISGGKPYEMESKL